MHGLLYNFINLLTCLCLSSTHDKSACFEVSCWFLCSVAQRQAGRKTDLREYKHCACTCLSWAQVLDELQAREASLQRQIKEKQQELLLQVCFLTDGHCCCLYPIFQPLMCESVRSTCVSTTHAFTLVSPCLAAPALDMFMHVMSLSTISIHVQHARQCTFRLKTLSTSCITMHTHSKPYQHHALRPSWWCPQIHRHSLHIFSFYLYSPIHALRPSWWCPQI